MVAGSILKRLVLSRREFERAALEGCFDSEGNPVEIWIALGRVSGKRGQIVIDAPASVKIRREEITTAQG